MTIEKREILELHKFYPNLYHLQQLIEKTKDNFIYENGP
jgi:hypothetical protein